MDSVLAKALDHAPEVAAMLIVVVLFLRYIGARDKAMAEALAKFESSISTAHDSCHEIQIRTVNAVQENSRVLGEASSVMRGTVELIRAIHNGRDRGGTA
jgi:hypothetical protein